MTNLDDAKKLFYEKKYLEAREIFLKENDLYSSGLCSLLLKDEKSALRYWSKDKKTSPASQWGLCVLRFIHLSITKKPTFFQTRAFLEVYLNLFLENNLIEWAQNLVSCCDKLYYSNPETYKFIARALFANGYFDLAINFCKKSVKLIYCDPEAFLIMAQCQYLLNDIAEALDSTNRTLAMVPDYYPAKLFRKILKENIEKKYS